MSDNAGDLLPAAPDEGVEPKELDDQAAARPITPLESAPVGQGHSSSLDGLEDVPDVVEELEALRIERQASATSVSSSGANGGSGGGGGGSTGALFAGQEEEDEAAMAPAPPQAEPAADSAVGSQIATGVHHTEQEQQQQQQQLAALRSAQAAASAAAAAAAGGASPGTAAAAHTVVPPTPAAEEAQLSAHAKHVFVFSTAGKPIFSYRGDEARLAGVMATAEAILSVAHSKGHTLKHVRAGPYVFVFLERPPLCLVGVSAMAEPPAVMRMQLTLVHGQIVSLLTSTALHAMFARNPGYDARNLLSGSEGMLSALIDSFTAAPATLLGAYPSLPLLGGVRQALAAALATTVKVTGAVHGIVVAGGHVAAACPAVGVAPLQQWDVLLLLNLLAANESFRHSGEAMTPICLPRYNSAANLHAYISYADGATQTAAVLLCGGMPDPAALSAAVQRMQQQLEAIGALQALVLCAAQEQQASSSTSNRAGLASSRDSSSSSGLRGVSSGGSLGPAGAGGGGGEALLAVPSLPPAAGGGSFGVTPLLHFVYKLSGRQQYVSSAFSPQLVEGGLQQPLIVAFSQLRAAMFESSSLGSGPLQRLRYEARPRFVLLGAVSQETELYLACDPLTDKAEAAGLASRLGMWLRARHDQLFSLC